MGTRSLVIVSDKWTGKEPKEIAVIYRQFDGYREGMGADLVEILDGIKVTNGLEMDGSKSANGADDLAALIVWGLKNVQQRSNRRQHKWALAEPDNKFRSYAKGYWPAGNVYLMPAGTRDAWEEYRYEFTFCHSSDGDNYAMKDVCRLFLKVVEVHSAEYGGDKTLYDSGFSGFKPWLTVYKRKQAAERRAEAKREKELAKPLGS